MLASIKSLWSRFVGIFREKTIMSDATAVIEPAIATPLADPVAAQIAAVVEPVPVPAAAPVVVTDTDKLKSLLLVLGHDIEADWEHVVALAKKVL